MKNEDKQAAVQLSVRMQAIAAALSNLLNEVAEAPVAFMLATSTDGVVQYVGNTSRADAIGILEELLERWRGGRADIPAHISPDLPVDGQAVPAPAMKPHELEARGDGALLRMLATPLSYNGTAEEAMRKHRLYEIAGRIETGFYPCRDPAPKEKP